MDVVVQIAYRSRGGGLVPLAQTKDGLVVRLVARRILSDLRSQCLSDDILDELVQQEADRMERALTTLRVIEDVDEHDDRADATLHRTAEADDGQQ